MNKFIALTGLFFGLSLSAGCLVDVDAPEVEDEGVGTVESEAKKKKIFCGGLAGIQCPGGLVCVDDPTDNCDSAQDSDCGGICKKPKGKPACNTNGNSGGKSYVGNSPEECAVIKFICAAGYEYFSDACGCGCQPATPVEACGPNTCSNGQVCCNASCGICTEPGGFCTQQACLPTN